MSPEAWAETTDVGVALEDEDGQAIYSSAFDNNTFEDTIDHPTPGEDVALKLKIRAGFAVSDDQRKTPITVDLDHLLAEPVSLEVTRNESSNVDFAPAVPIDVEFEAAAALPKAPDETHPTGYLRFRERHSNEEALYVPIHLAD